VSQPTHAAVNRERPSFADAAEIEAFVAELARFERGEIDAEAWRAYRVARGAYSQRQENVYMLRVKIPQGIATAAQLRALADVAARWSRGYGHVTTRQNVQFHFVQPADLEPALRLLAGAGITTSGAGGNTVRNVAACPYAGVAPDEPFDVTPYAEAVTRHFLRHPLASSLPRKLKLAFEGCQEDHAATAIQDLGFRARIREERGLVRRGFAVTVAGGTSSLCTSGHPLFEFFPAEDVLSLAEALVRLFHARGDRKNKQRNRLKFLVRELGFEKFQALLQEELARVRMEGAPTLPFDVDAGGEAPPPRTGLASPSPAELAARIAAAPLRGPGLPPAIVPLLDPRPDELAAFRAANVRPQRQAGFSVVTVAPPQGDVGAAQLDALADLALAYGDGAVRFSNAGHVHLRWVRDADLAALFARLAAAGLGRAGAGTAGDVLACPGGEACRLAVTRTRAMARLVEERIRGTLGAAALSAPLSVRVSGCPNGCSQHHLAAIGLQGSARKLGTRTAPQYFVLLGGGLTDDGARFGRLAGKVPARRVPEAVRRLTALWLEHRRPGESAGSFFARTFEDARAALSDLEALRVEDAGPEDFIEPGTDTEFRPDVQEGECAA
jgi:sulfite reductase beta subunit-like hemoprotein